MLCENGGLDGDGQVSDEGNLAASPEVVFEDAEASGASPPGEVNQLLQRWLLHVRRVPAKRDSPGYPVSAKKSESDIRSECPGMGADNACACVCVGTPWWISVGSILEYLLVLVRMLI
jgi:hypothetical protein